MSKAMIALVNIGSNVEIEGLRLPSGTFAVSVSQVAALFGLNSNQVSRALKPLLGLDGFSNTFSELSNRPVNIISLSQLDTLTKILATKGNVKAQELLGIPIFIRDKKSREANGLIYVYLDSGNNAYKIGFTTDLAKRDRQHKTSNPFMRLVKTFKNKTLQHESILHKALKSYRIPEASEWYQNHPEVIAIINKTLSSKIANILTIEQTMAHTEISLPQKTPLSFSKTDNYPSLMFKLGDRLSSLTRLQTYTLVGAIGLYLSGVSEDIEESKKVFNSPDPLSTDPYDADNLSFPERVTKCLNIIERENPEGLTDILLAISDYWEQYSLQRLNHWGSTLLG